VKRMRLLYRSRHRLRMQPRRFSHGCAATVLLAALLLPLSGHLAAAAVPGTTTAARKANHSPAASVRCKHRNAAIGTVRYSHWQFPDTLNPYQTSTVVSGSIISGMFDSLLGYDNRGRLYPVMIRQIPTIKNGDVSAGGRVIALRLKQGMQWSNGAEITSSAVWFGWKVDMDAQTGPACTLTCDVVQQITTPNRYTAILYLKRPRANLPTVLPSLWPRTWPGAWANDPHAAAMRLGQDGSFDFEGTGYPTNGPFQVESFVRDDRIVLHPMNHYTIMSCGAHIRNLIFAFFSSKPALIAAAATGATDLTQGYTNADLPLLRQHRDRYRVDAPPAFTFEHLEFNLDPTYGGSPNPLAVRDVRIALALGLDKLGLIRSALGINLKQAHAIVAWTPWINTRQLKLGFADASVNGQWDPLQRNASTHGYGTYVQPGTPTALQHAKQLLRRTKYAHGFSLDLVTTSGNPVRAAQVEVLRNNWAQLGVTVNAQYIPGSRLFGQWSEDGTMDHGDFQVAMSSITNGPDPDVLRYQMESRFIDRTKTVHSTINSNYAGIKDYVIDRAFERATRDSNRQVRRNSYYTVQKRMTQQMYWVLLYFRPFITTTSFRIQGIKPGPLGPYWNMYQWRVGRLQ
jgi:peptide/nickel transport system substrate-binding protein